MNVNSVVFYDGPSQLTGAAIVGVVSGLRHQSLNKKTGGRMLQVWILLRDLSPKDAIERGLDDAICGDCALRGDGKYGRGCYVTYWQAPLRVWTALPNTPRQEPGVVATRIGGRVLRLGAYGDPVAIPLDVWERLLRQTAGAIGYTQRWDRCDPAYRAFLMASVLSSVAQPEAAALGWRTYRVRGPRDPLLAGEVVCPASDEAHHKLHCVDCMLCSGVGHERAANPVIIAHGKPGNLKVFGVKPLYKIGRKRVIPLTAV